MSTEFQRAPITAWLLAHIEEDSGFPCGDAVIPPASGWSGSQPNAPGASFKPYTVLTTMGATPAPMTGDLQVPQEDWHVSYLVQSFGVARLGAETLADSVRAIFGAYKNQIIDCHTRAVDAPSNYKVQQVWWQSIGGVNRTPGTDPAFFGEQDQFTMWMAKRRT